LVMCNKELYLLKLGVSEFKFEVLKRLEEGLKRHG
jgi:hypothetical protein